jgi:rubrerythrin
MRFYVSILFVAAYFLGNGNNMTAKESTLSPQTQKDLVSAMHRDAFAYAKYMLYAAQARENGRADLADLFEKTATTERFAHFADEARLAGLGGTDADNLQDAIQSELDEFARHASAPEDKAAADLFERIRHDEMKHREAFKAELARSSRYHQTR